MTDIKVIGHTALQCLHTQQRNMQSNGEVAESQACFSEYYQCIKSGQWMKPHEMACVLSPKQRVTQQAPTAKANPKIIHQLTFQYSAKWLMRL